MTGRGAALVDTSVAVPLLLLGHEHHETTRAAVLGRTLGLAGHAWFETYSVMTRLPPPDRRLPSEVARMLEVGFPGTRFLPAEDAIDLATTVADQGIAGGAVYDAIVGAAACAADLPLLTRDKRAVKTYRATGARFEVIEP